MPEIHHTNKNEVAWTSWLPALGQALASSVGPVLEIGIGHFSTPFLHEYCQYSDRDLWSVEDNLNWAEELKNDYQSKHHSFCVGSYDDILPTLAKAVRLWGVVFIDNSPGGEARAKPFRLFLPQSKFVVVHDYHRENEEAIKPLLDNTEWKVFSDYEPPTLLAQYKRP